MQTTLLGVAIAFIVALVAALVGPVFIDWNEFRPRFEAEATRALGVPVRVAGPLDARLLPVPSLRLKSVSISGPNDPGRLRADGFDVDLSLGALMRGEVRATELSISGVSLDLGLDDKGQIDWPAGGQLNLRTLAIDRLNVTGRVALHDAASRSTVELSDIAFSGDVRPQAGALRGEGNFQLSGNLYPFRISTMATEQGGTRLKLAVDAVDLSMAGELDGLLVLDDRKPRFDGNLQFGRIAGAKADKGDTRPPWKMTAKLKADPARATFDQLEWGRGADDAQKLTGRGEMRFGATPILNASLTAKSIDATQWMEAGSKAVASALPRLLNSLGDLPQLPFAADISVGAEQILLAGKPAQNATIDLSTTGEAWRLTRLDFRGPGATQVTLGGAPTPSAGSQFEGRLDLASADPDAFVNWLQGRSDPGARLQKPLSVGGDLTFGPLAIALDNLTAHTGESVLSGRVAWTQPDVGPSKIEVALQGDRVDLDTGFAMLRASFGPQGRWPDSGEIAIDLAHAVAAGQSLSPFSTAMNYNPDRVTLERLRVGEASGVTLDGSGAFNRKAARGSLALSGSAPSLAGVTAMLTPLSPELARKLSVLTQKDGPSKMSLALDLDSDAAKPDSARARATLQIAAPSLSGTVSASTSPSAQAIRALDLDALPRGEIAMEAKLTAARGDALISLLGIENVVETGNDALTLDGSVTGAWNAPLRGSVKLSGKSFDADVHGSAEPWSEPARAALQVAVRKANLNPVLGLPKGAPAQEISFASRLAVAGNRLTFDGIDGVIGGARVRGRAAASLDETKTFEGEIGLDRLDLAPVYAYAIGAAGHDPGEPLRPGPLHGWRGKMSVVALRGVLPGGVEVQPLSATLTADGPNLSVDGIKAKLDGGDISGSLEMRPGPAGLSLGLQLQSTELDATALRYRELAMPNGKAAVKLSLAAQGRSAAALASAVSGDGVATLSALRIPGLDPKAFDVAVKASDSGEAINDAGLRKQVDAALSSGSLSVDAALVPFTIRDGSLRVGATLLEAEGARALVSGGYDFAADQTDLRATLTSMSLKGPAGGQPEISVFLAGPPDRLNRSLDIASLSSWLAIRAIDRETRRLDALEREAPTAALASPPPQPAKPSEPLPVDAPPVRPKRPRMAPRAFTVHPSTQPGQPLPPATTVAPAPGAPRVVRPPWPLSLLPPASVPRPAF